MAARKTAHNTQAGSRAKGRKPASSPMTSAARVIGTAVGKVVAGTGRLLQRNRAGARASAAGTSASESAPPAKAARRSPSGARKKPSTAAKRRKRSSPTGGK